MNALRMVWIISRHYSDDVKMGNLFKRIACVLGNRVKDTVTLSRLFEVSAADGLRIIEEASTLLSEWRETYMKVRERIEMSNQHARWEFPKTMLFERTGHIGDILRDLKFMVETVDDFFKFLGPELKAVTGDTQVRDNGVHGKGLVCVFCSPSVGQLGFSVAHTLGGIPGIPQGYPQGVQVYMSIGQAWPSLLPCIHTPLRVQQTPLRVQQR